MKEGTSKRLSELCEALPADVMWSDPLTPDIADHIWQAALSSKWVLVGAIITENANDKRQKPRVHWGECDTELWDSQGFIYELLYRAKRPNEED